MVAVFIFVGLSILVLGESYMSLVDYFIEFFNVKLVQMGVKVYFIGVCGVSVGDWLIIKKVDCGVEQIDNGKIQIKGCDVSIMFIVELIVKDKLDLVVLVIGDIMVFYDKLVFFKVWVW